MKHLLTALTLLLSPTAPLAGDPCPILVQVHDLGSPPWLDNAALVAELESRQIWLGFRYDIDEDGIDIASVYPGSPMDRAGLTRDDVIRSINDRPVRSYGTFNDIVDGLAIGDSLQLDVDRNGTARRVALTVGHRDPVALRIVQALHAEDCRTAELRALNPDIRERILPAFYDANRRFRCDDAHASVAAAHDAAVRDDVFILRGSRRIILTMPGWATLCIDASALDGANLTDANALAVINRVIGDYVADRHANP